MHFYSTPRKILSLCNLPLKISFVLNQWLGGVGGWGVDINAIAQ